MKSLIVQLIVAAIVVALLFFFWPGFTTTLVIGIAAGMVLANISPAIESFVEGLIAKIRPG
jgi:phosphotransferase system  glucose/maltose/N-acetylglucosamine-specific IIC component